MLNFPVLSRKKILVFIDWFYPGYKAGGPIQSCVNFAYAMQNDYDVFVFTSDTDHGESVPYSNVEKDKWVGFQDTKVKIWYSGKENLKFSKIRQIIKEVNPDFLYLNSMYSPKFVLFPLWLKINNQVNSKVILCPRGALYDSALSIKKYKKIPFLKLFTILKIQNRIIFQATNYREKAAIEKHFSGSSIKLVDDFMATKQGAFKSCEKRPGELKLIFIARIFPIKNLLFLLECLNKCKSNIYFSIVGPIEDTDYWNKCQNIIGELPGNIRVTYLGPQKNADLYKHLLSNHLYVLPSTGESFGHSIFEALLAGRPVLISDQTPWLLLEDKKIGWDLPLNDPGKFTEAIDVAAAWDQLEFDNMSKSAWEYAKQYIRSSDILKQYGGLFS